MTELADPIINFLKRLEFHALRLLRAYYHEELTTLRAFIAEVVRLTCQIEHDLLPAEPRLMNPTVLLPAHRHHTSVTK
jgi:hypothetical protein